MVSEIGRVENFRENGNEVATFLLPKSNVTFTLVIVVQQIPSYNP